MAPADAAEARIDERDDRVEVRPRDGAEHQDDREQSGRGGSRVLEQLQPRVPRGELLRCYSRADHDGREKC